MLRALLAGVLVLLTPAARAIEEPAFEVVQADKDFELRRYAPYHIVSTPAGSTFEDTGDVGFRPLFRYISGNNATGTDMAMTAPVLQTRDQTDWRLAFVVPATLGAERIPAPTAPGMQVETVAGGLYAVRRFSGGWGEQRFLEQEAALQAALDARGLIACGPTRYARYDPPFKPTFLRRNEILIPVADGNCASAL
ncbi:MAG: SOUL family heme-binding protein [Gammaproteobacteria bacterium]